METKSNKNMNHKMRTFTLALSTCFLIAACSPEPTEESKDSETEPAVTNKVAIVEENKGDSDTSPDNAKAEVESQQADAGNISTPPVPIALPKKETINQIVQETTNKIKEAMKYEVVHLNASEAVELLKENKNIKILDVRTPGEFAEGRIASALNIDFRNPEFAKNLSKLDGSTEYLIHCKSGGRSTAALDIFEKLGFGKVYHLDGGFDGWKKAGNDVQTNE